MPRQVSPLINDGFFSVLDKTPYGAYAMDMDRRIIFWSRSAERIAGHEASHVVGRQCYEVLYGLPEQPSAPTCRSGCFTLSLADAERIAPVAHVRMRCASGKRKRVAVMTLLIPGTSTEPPVVLHLFHERASELGVWRISKAIQSRRQPAFLTGSQTDKSNRRPLTPREWEIVELLAEGCNTSEIAARLHLSTHTVRNYVRNAREKLNAPSRLALVLAARRQDLSR